MSRSSLKSSEETFKKIPRKKPLLEDCETAEAHRDKNRYVDALPNDKYRLKINKKCGDYVNISRVKIGPGRWTLCGQGPTATTVYDFWRAVIESGTEIVVMLTRIREGEREKCFPYLPSDTATFECQDCMMDFPIKVCLESQGKSEDGAFCTSSVRLRMGFVEKTVIHIQYLRWDDFNVPNPEELRVLISVIDRYNLPLVHCSAGLGRTGTLIAILRRKLTGEEADEAIDKIRKYRSGLVTTLSQYRIVKSET